MPIASKSASAAPNSRADCAALSLGCGHASHSCEIYCDTGLVSYFSAQGQPFREARRCARHVALMEHSATQIVQN